MSCDVILFLGTTVMVYFPRLVVVNSLCLSIAYKLG